MGLIEDLRQFERSWEHKQVVRTVQLPGLATAAIRKAEYDRAIVDMVEAGWQDVDPATEPFPSTDTGSVEVVTLLVFTKRIKRPKV